MNGYKEFREVILAILVGGMIAIVSRPLIAESLAPIYFGIAGAVMYMVASAMLGLVERACGWQEANES